MHFVPRLKWVKPLVLDGLQATLEINNAYSEKSLLTDYLGLTGEGEVIGLGDTGVRTENCFLTSSTSNVITQRFDGSYINGVVNITDHPSIVQYYSYPTAHLDTDANRDSARHGTYLAAIMVGKPPSSFPVEEIEPNKGIARNAKLAIMDLQDGNSNLDVPANLGAMLDVAYQGGARIYCNSFSGYLPSKLNNYDDGANYSLHTNSLDNYTYFKQDLLVVVPAGFSDCLNSASAIGSLGWSKVRLDV
jgi:hypothetical protein